MSNHIQNERMEITFEKKQLAQRVIKMAKLRSGCTCWGPWFKCR